MDEIRTGLRGALPLLLVILMLLSVPRALFAQSTAAGITVSVSTDKSSYTGGDTMLVKGTLSPPAGSGISVLINDPTGTTIASQSVAIAENGSFSATFHLGGQGFKTSGTYSVVATLQQPDSVAPPPTASVNIQYTAIQTTSASPSTSSASTSSSSGSSSSVLLYAGAAVALVVIIVVIALAMVVRGRSRASAGAPSQKQ